jgi:hypothetical protein
MKLVPAVEVFGTSCTGTKIATKQFKKDNNKVKCYSFKGTVSRDFRPLGFSLNGTPGYPDSWAEAVFEFAE